MSTVRGKGKTTEELLAMQAAIDNDPKNRMPPGNLNLYTKNARRKLDDIAQAISDNMADKRAAAGDPVPTCGYSGRQTNRRR